jgi:plastocyanin
MLAALAVAGFATAGFATSRSAAPNAPEATSRVSVIATEFRFRLSRRAVPTGTVIFTVVNRGKIPHDFKIAGKKTRLLQAGKSATLRVKISKKGPYSYICTVLGHAAGGMKGVLQVGASTAPAPRPTTTTTTTTPTTTTTTTTTTVPGPASTINVGMFEYRFELVPPTVPAGTVTFVITNRGAEPHNFSLTGRRVGAFLNPGQSETWSIGLPAGNYEYVCDVPFHIGFGMQGTLTVTP